MNPLLAFLAGMLTVAAPCVLPMLPVVLGASVGQQDRSRPVFIALGFALAFSTVALVFSAFARVWGVSQDALRDVAIGLLLVFGVLMVWPRPFQWLMLHAGGWLSRVSSWGDGAASSKLGGKFSGLVLGLSLGAVWTPCAGPVLGSILTLIATQADTGRSAALLACYSLGAALPMLGIAYGGQYAFSRVRQLARHMHRVQQAFGVLVIGVAVAMHLQYDSLIAVWLSQFYPQNQLGL